MASYGELSRDQQLEAFYIDLQLEGPSRFTPHAPSPRQLDQLHDRALAEIPSADPLELYAETLVGQAEEYLHSKAAEVLGIMSVES